MKRGRADDPDASIFSVVETIDFSDDEDTPQPELQQRQLRLDVWSDVA